MASNVEKDPKSGDVTSVQLDEVIQPGDPRWGIHNPEVGPSDTLSVHDEDVSEAADAAQVDVPQADPVPSDELYRVDPEEQPSQQAASAESDSKKSSSKSSDKS